MIQRFIENYDYQLKFVVERREDFVENGALLDQLTGVEPERVWSCPRGSRNRRLSRKALWIVELCQKYHYRFTPRLHIQLFGNRRGT